MRFTQDFSTSATTLWKYDEETALQMRNKKTHYDKKNMIFFLQIATDQVKHRPVLMAR